MLWRTGTWVGSRWTDWVQERGQDLSLHHRSSCRNTNASANYLPDSHMHFYIADRQISPLVWCFRSLTGCGHSKAAKSLHHHPPPCSCPACTAEQQKQQLCCFVLQESSLLLYWSRMIAHRWRVRALLDACLAPISWRKLKEIHPT